MHEPTHYLRGACCVCKYRQMLSRYYASFRMYINIEHNLHSLKFVIHYRFTGKFRREFRNALDKCRCGRVRVEDRSMYHSTPASRINNISPSSRSNYQLTSLRDMTSLRDRQVMLIFN